MRLSLRSGTPLSVLAIDLDGFKHVNDRYGHAIGDDLLVEVSRRILDQCTPEDFVARLGGDEFVIVRHSELQSAKQLAQHIVSVLSEPITIEGIPIQQFSLPEANVRAAISESLLVEYPGGQIDPEKLKAVRGTRAFDLAVAKHYMVDRNRHGDIGRRATATVAMAVGYTVRREPPTLSYVPDRNAV